MEALGNRPRKSTQFLRKRLALSDFLLERGILEVNPAVRRHTMSEPDVPADDRSRTNHGVTSKYRRSRVDDDIVLNGRD